MSENSEIDTGVSIANAILEMNFPPEPTTTWIDTLPLHKIHGPQVGDIQDTGENLMRYSSHWDGKYNQESLTLELKPKLTPDISEYQGVFYDRKLAKVENGEIIPILNGNFKLLGMDEYGNTLVPERECPSTDGDTKLMFRGINYEGMQTALQNGKLESGSLMRAHGIGHIIFFSRYAERAFGYAARGEGVYYTMATFDKPSYVIVLEEPGWAKTDHLGDVQIDAPIDTNRIKKVYEIRPYAITPGNIPYVEDIRTIISKESVQKMEEIGQEPFLELPDIFTQIRSGPKGRFVYKEVNIDNIKKDFGYASSLNNSPTELKT